MFTNRAENHAVSANNKITKIYETKTLQISHKTENIIDVSGNIAKKIYRIGRSDFLTY